jgi:WD40 repeat protein
MSVRGGWAAAVGDNGAVVRWDVDPAGQWTSPEVLAGHRGDVLEAEADPAGRSLLTAGADHTVVVWDMTPDGVFGADYPAVAGRWVSNRPAVVDPGALVVAPTRSLPASGTLTHVDEGEDTLDVSATFFEPGTGRVVDSVPVGRTLPLTLFGSSVSVSPDRRFVAVTWGLGTTVLDARTRAPVATVQIPADTPVPEVGILTAEPVWCTGWTPDGTRLLIGTETDLLGHTGGVLTVVDTATWQVTGQEVDVGITPQVLEPSPDGRLLAVAASGAPEVVLLDGGTLAERSRIELASDDLVYDLAFSPDGRLLAAAGDRGDLHLLDVVTGAPARDPVPVHGGEVLQVEWLADGRTIATAGIDGTVALYDVDRGLLRGRPLPATASGGPAYAHLVPGTPGELVTVPGERPGRRYPLDPAGWLRAACAVAGRDLTRAEWDRYLPGRPWQPTCSDLR